MGASRVLDCDSRWTCDMENFLVLLSTLIFGVACGVWLERFRWLRAYYTKAGIKIGNLRFLVSGELLYGRRPTWWQR